MPTVDLNSTVEASEAPVTTTVDGEVVLLNTETGTYQGFRGTGSRIWELIQTPTTVRAVVERITAEYDVEADRCEQDVLAFVEHLAEENLIEIHGQSPA